MDIARLSLYALAAAFLCAALILVGKAAGVSRALLSDIVLFVTAGFLITGFVSEQRG